MEGRGRGESRAPTLWTRGRKKWHKNLGVKGDMQVGTTGYHNRAVRLSPHYPGATFPLHSPEVAARQGRCLGWAEVPSMERGSGC